MKLRHRESMWVCALVAAGCGGGQGGSLGNAASHTSNAGEAVLTYFGQPKPQLTASSGEVSMVGQAGATFSAVTLEPPPNLDDTYLVICRSELGVSQLYKIPYASGTAQVLYQNASGSAFPAISAYGTVAFDGTDDNFDNAYAVRADGTGYTQLSFTGLTNVTCPTYSTDGTNRLAFTSNGGLFVGPSGGGSPTLVQSNAVFGDTPRWSSGGNQILYEVATSGSFNDLYTTASSGGTATDATPTALRNAGELYAQGWSADGVTLLAAYSPGGGNAEIIKFPMNNPSEYSVLTPSGDDDYEACFSPDGSKIAFYRANVNSATPGIYLADSTGGNQQLWIPDPAGGANEAELGMAWSPFLPKETVIAASGATFYHQASSGFLLSQNGAQFGSLVAFTATTPATAAIQAPSSSGTGAPMIFTLTADSITQIGYINTYFSTGTIVSPATPSALVSVDATTGQVDLVAPSATPKPESSRNPDGTVTYNSTFKAVFDGAGKNLAPSGATRIVLNPKTGHLVSLR